MTKEIGAKILEETGIESRIQYLGIYKRRSSHGT
jgi:hypothetical protein